MALAAAIVLFARAARAADGDCLEVLEARSHWSCHAQLSNGQGADYCLAFTHAFGNDAGSRIFRMATTGPFPRTCTCRAKSGARALAFGADSDYLCLDRATGTVETGRVSKRRIAGETFNASAGVRSTFGCVPDPPCPVQAVIDPDLPPVDGRDGLGAGGTLSEGPLAPGGPVAVGYLGCEGFASEAPTFVFDLESGAAGSLSLGFFPDVVARSSIVAVSPFGEIRCIAVNSPLAATVRFDPAPSGRYSVWVAVQAPGASVEGALSAVHTAR
jgi:hypothetical protein